MPPTIAYLTQVKVRIKIGDAAPRTLESPCGISIQTSWQLMRRSKSGEEEMLAKGVLAYDLAGDGRIIYSNGNAIFVRHADGRTEQLVKERMIEQVTVLD
jgi:hypothetical protein